MELFISIGIMNLNNSDLRLNRTHLNLKKDFLVQIQQDADRNIARLRALGKLKRRVATAATMVFGAGILLTGQVSAVTSFTETFDNGNANWGDPISSPAGADHNAGGFITTGGALADLGQGVLFRGQAGLGSSGGAFTGNWIADDVSQFSVDVRHNSQVPLSFFARFASPFNFPGATAVQFQPVLANQWTTLTFNIADNPQFGAPNFVTFEGSSFEGVFSNIGNVQVGVSIPEGFENNPALANGVFTFDMDNASVTAIPEPSGTLLAMAGGLLLLRRRRRSS